MSRLSPWHFVVISVFCLLLALFAADDTVFEVAGTISFLTFVFGGLWLVFRITEELGITKYGECKAGEWKGPEPEKPVVSPCEAGRPEQV